MRYLLALILCCAAHAETVHVKSDRLNPAVRDDRGNPYKTSSHGHGVYISAHRIITVNHVIESNDVFVEFGKQWIACKIIKRDPKNDLCLLETESTAKTVAPLAKVSPVATVQHRDKQVPVTPSRIVMLGKFSVGDEDSPSGCPLLNRDGELCGIVTEAFRNIEKKNGKDVEGPIIGVHAVPVEIIEEFLK